MSTNNAYITEEYLHRRVADVLRDASKLKDDLNRSEAEGQALRQRVDALEKSQALSDSSGQSSSGKSLVDKLKAEQTELRQQLSEDKQKLRGCTEQLQRMQHANGKLMQQVAHFARQQDELSSTHQREAEGFRLKIQQQEAEIQKLRQSLVPSKDLNVGQPQNDELHAKVLLLEAEICVLRNDAETSDQFHKHCEAELERNRSMLRKANETIKRFQAQKTITQTSPNTTRGPHPGREDALQASGSNRIIDNPDSSMSPATYLSPLPEKRKEALDVFPLITVAPNDHGAKALFSRDYLTSQIGGGVQSVIANVNVNKPRPLAAYGIHCYLCPNMEQNPWCPTRPGMHGYIFVGLGKEVETFNKQETHHVFISIGTKQYRYLGMYEALRMKEQLPVEEWKPLPENFKNKYSKTTAEKTINCVRTAAQTRAAYDSGVLRVPCVRLICVAFDQELYTSLVNANVGNGPAPSSGSGKGKRQKYSSDDDDDDDDDDYVSLRRKSMRTSF